MQQPVHHLSILCLTLLIVQGCQHEAASQPAASQAGKAAAPAGKALARAPVVKAPPDKAPPAGAPAAGARPPAAKATPGPVGPALDFDLGANLPLAHVYRGGVVADAASVGFVKYIRDLERRWKLGQLEDGRPAAFPPGKQAQLWLPVGPELAGQALVLELQFKPIRQQRLDLFVNEQKVGEPALGGSWQQVRLPLPKGLVKPGLALVRLYFGRARAHAQTRTCAALRYARIAAATAPAAPADEAGLAAFLRSGGTSAGGALVLPPDGGLDYYLMPVKGLRLRGKVSGGEVRVLAQRDGEQPRQLGAARDGELDVALDAVAGQATRLMLRGGGGKGAAVSLSRARLAGARPGPSLKATRPRHVIFWLVDALRSDRLDFYDPRGNARPQVKTPNLSAIARQGVVFEPFWVNSNESKAGHASYFTGTYPAVHKVVSHRAKLRESHLTLAEAFREAGYRTGGFISNGYISKQWNYDQGFEQMTNFIREGKPNDARAVVDSAIPWIDKHKDQPFYLYLGTSDTHVTYRVHKEFIGQYDTGPAYKGPYRRNVSGDALGRIKQAKRPPPPRERDRIAAVYDNELAYNDKHFGRLLAHLRKAGIEDQTLIIISSDHGEEFWEHGSCGHGNGLHQEQVSVPLVLRWPGVLPAGRVVNGHDGVDLLPTVLALLGREPPADVQGESLLPFIGADQVYPRAMVASTEADSYALRVGTAKVIARSAVTVEVYDVAADPTEQQSRYRTHPVLTLVGLDPLSLFIARAADWRKASWGVANNLAPGSPAGAPR